MKDFARFKDAALAYSRDGSGTPLLCLHGGMGVDSATLSVPGICGLGQRGCEVITFDQRGHGGSSGAGPTEYTHQLWSTDAFDLTQHFRWTQFALLGHSYGGFIAIEYAVRWLQTLSHLILVSTSAGPVRTVAPTVFSEEELRNYFSQRWPQFFAGADKHWDLFQKIRFSAPAFNAAFGRELPAYDLRSRVRNISIPVLLLVGDKDHYRSDMEWLAGELPNALLHVFRNVGHFPFVEAQDAFLDIVADFLAGNSGRKENRSLSGNVCD